MSDRDRDVPGIAPCHGNSPSPLDRVTGTARVNFLELQLEPQARAAAKLTVSDGDWPRTSHPLAVT